MSAIRGLQCKFRNNFRELRYRGGIFAKFAVGKQSVIARAVGSWQSPAFSLISIREIPTVVSLLRNDDLIKSKKL